MPWGIVLIDWLHHDGVACQPGDRIELTEQQLASLQAAGAVEVAPEPDPESKPKPVRPVKG